LKLANTFAGTLGANTEFRDWFAFQLPSVGTFTSATLNIWNDTRNFSDVAGPTFELRDASAISFAGLAGATTLGSVSVEAADAGVSRFVPITLNAAALSLLNAAQGGPFLFGGVVTPFSSGNVQIFGYTTGPPAAFLRFAHDPAPVPEPMSLLLVGSGLAALVARRRRSRKRA
jgi:hypothetical protein